MITIVDDYVNNNIVKPTKPLFHNFPHDVINNFDDFAKFMIGNKKDVQKVILDSYTSDCLKQSYQCYYSLFGKQIELRKQTNIKARLSQITKFLRGKVSPIDKLNLTRELNNLRKKIK